MTFAPPIPDRCRRLGDDPFVAVVDDAVPVAWCARVVARARPLLQPSRVNAQAPDRARGRRTGSVAWLAHDIDATVASLCAALAARAGLPLATAEALQVVRYVTGERYPPHHDAWLRPEARDRGQRGRTALLYLSDVEAGGATRFPRLDLQIAPRCGRVLVFDTCGPDGVRNPGALHEGLPVSSGDKWIANLWFRQHEAS